VDLGRKNSCRHRGIHVEARDPLEGHPMSSLSTGTTPD
jgi:hypothetical protein